LEWVGNKRKVIKTGRLHCKGKGTLEMLTGEKFHLKNKRYNGKIKVRFLQLNKEEGE